MIPPFNDSGHLPPGVHPASLDEIEARFGAASEVRRVQMESVRWMVELAHRAGVQRIILNGSFTTGIMELNDVDCVLLIDHEHQGEPEAEVQLEDGLPFLDIMLVGQRDFDELLRDGPQLGTKRHDRGANMTLRHDAELASTRRKLCELEARFAELEGESTYDDRLRRHTARSLKKLINQLKEEITRYESRRNATSPQASHSLASVRESPSHEIGSR